MNPKETILYIYDYKYRDQVSQLEKLRISQNYNVLKYFIRNNDTIYLLKEHINLIYSKYNLKYIVLVGSIEEVPTFMRKGVNEGSNKTIYNMNTETASCDMFYGMINSKTCKSCNSNICYGLNNCYENFDYKIIVGRLTPGDNIYGSISELTYDKKIINIQNQVDKIISYEHIIDILLNGNVNPLIDGWLDNIIGIASNEGSNIGIDGLSDNEYMNRELDKFDRLMNCRYTELYQGCLLNSVNNNDKNNHDNTDDPNYNELIQELNKGCSLMLYAGHANEVSLSTTGFSNNHMDRLDNFNKYFLGCVVGCSFGSHDENYMSLAENLQVSKNKGSIAMFASTILQSWLPPMYMQRELNNTIINSDKTLTIGEIFDKAVKNDVFYKSKDFWYYHLLGDPSTRYILTCLNDIKLNNNESHNPDNENNYQIPEKRESFFSRIINFFKKLFFF